MPIPTPHANESQADFMARGHEALANDFPETDQRNAVLFQKWREQHGEGDLEKKAFSRFGDDQFVHVRDVPVFSEHEYERPLRDADGQPLLGADGTPQTVHEKYDRAALQAICDRCNYRISDTGDFAALCEGHTPTKEEKAQGAKMPDVLGFQGPFRLGMIGNERPRWAIFADEHPYRDQYEKVKRLPRRSPEIWLESRMADRFMDPVAALGAETPRLDMGMRFARTGSGRVVEKYSAACLPGGGSTTLPGPVERKVEKYSDPNVPDPTNADSSAHSENHSMLSPEDVKQIVEAVMATEPMMWVREQMLIQQPPEEELPPDTSLDNSTPSSAPAAGGAPPAAHYPSPGDHSMPEPKKPEDKAAYEAASEKARYAKLETEVEQLKSQIADEQKARVQVERFSKLNELRMTFAFDLEKEVSRCQPMDADQFAKHLDCITENYQRIPVGASIYVPPLDKPQPQVEQYSRETVGKAIKLADELRAKGQEVDFSKLLKEAAAA